jgi:hypothetical protein
MGALDEAAFATVIGACAKCSAEAFEVESYIDRQTGVMLGERNDDGRWVHDGEKFIDGVFRVVCIRCRNIAFETKDCPRCHREGGLADALGTHSRLAVPKRCPDCKGTEMTTAGFAPSIVRTGEGRPPQPTPKALFGDAGFHVANVMCDGCDWVALADGCPLCGGPGPLRERPGSA